MLTDFQNSFTIGLSSDCVTIHYTLNALLHYPVELQCSKIDLISTLINTSCSFSVISLCKRSKDHVGLLAPLLYHQPTFYDNKFHQPRRSNDPSFKKYHVVAIKLHLLSRCHVTADVNFRCHDTVGSKTNLPSFVK